MKKFKLVELSIGYFAIVKANVETSVMPINVHGVIKVTDKITKYNSILLREVSKELLESGEIESLKREAIEETEEAVADEFPE